MMSEAEFFAGITGRSDDLVRLVAALRKAGHIRCLADRLLANRNTPEPAPTTFVRASPKTGRNDPCPCGSGRKFKHCCGKPA